MATLKAPLPDGPIGYIKDPRSGLLLPVTLDTDAWDPYFRSLETSVQSSPERLKTLTLTPQSATIGTTAVPMPAIATGLYRVSYRIQQTQVAGVSLALTVTIGWTRGVAQAQPFALLNTNTLATQQNGTVFVRSDRNTAITYAVLYASVGVPVGKFEFDITVEAIPA